MAAALRGVTTTALVRELLHAWARTKVVPEERLTPGDVKLKIDVSETLHLALRVTAATHDIAVEQLVTRALHAQCPLENEIAGSLMETK